MNDWFIGQIFRHLPTHFTFDALNEGDPLKLSGSYLVWENCNGWATIWWKLHDNWLGRLGTTHQRDRYTDSHVPTANATPTHCVKRQKLVLKDPQGWDFYRLGQHNINASKSVYVCEAAENSTRHNKQTASQITWWQVLLTSAQRVFCDVIILQYMVTSQHMRATSPEMLWRQQ